MSAKHLIIGSNSDSGAAYIDLLKRQGESVYTIARSGQADSIADVTDLEQLKRAIQEAGPELKSLAYFPGTIALKDLKSITDEDLQSNFDVNCRGALFASQYAAPALKAGNGSIVLISSVAAQKGFSNHSIISMCKAALEGLTVALAKELSPHVRVNCIAPSLSDTKLANPILGNDNVKQALAKSHALGRLGTAQDIANSVYFMTSNQSNWITGQVLGVDGGRSHLD